MWVFLAILAIPLIEIALFVTVGGAIGLWGTLAFVVLSAVLGIIVLKGVAMTGAVSLSPDMEEMRDPLSPLAHRVMLVIAGGMLLLPGFLTSAVGFLLLIPPLRQMIITLISKRFHAAGGMVQSTVIEGDWRDVTPESPSEPGNPPVNGRLH